MGRTKKQQKQVRPPEEAIGVEEARRSSATAEPSGGPVKLEPADYFRLRAAQEGLRATELEAQAKVREARSRYVEASQALCAKYGLDLRVPYDADDGAYTLTRVAAPPGGTK